MKYDFQLVMDEDNSLSKILKQIEPGSTVLEFGPASGRMTKYLKEVLGCLVYIVELDKEAALTASKFACDTVIGDIEDYGWLKKWDNIRFDYVVFADVLEHLRKPEKVLSSVKILLKDSGKVLLSVPNVAHNSILINLYNNIFNYTPVGLLDDTHIHLFAYNTLKAVCQNAGYIVVVEDAIYSKVGTNEVYADYNQVPRGIRNQLKQRAYGNVYQFVFTLQKKPREMEESTCLIRKVNVFPNEYIFQVFFDKGHSWLEENSVTIAFNPEKTKKFQIPVEKGLESNILRIDPINVSKVLHLEKVTVYRGTISEDIDLRTICITSNAHYVENNLYFFKTEDPNIYFENFILKDVDKIEITIRFFSHEEEIEAYYDVIQKQNNVIQEQNNIIRNFPR